MSTRSNTLSDPLLDRMQYLADPVADRFIASLLGPSPQEAAIHDAFCPPASDTHFGGHAGDPAWKNLLVLSRVFADWTNNRSLIDWQPDRLQLSPDSAKLLGDFVASARVLPAWADKRLILKAESLFSDFGALSGTLLPCSSLAECYVIPDIAVILHATRQLQEQTDYRIRSTGAMMLPIFLPGGLSDPDGYGAVQILKVRLVHASVRTLILRGDPEQVTAVAVNGIVPPLPEPRLGDDIHASLFANGWNLGNDGMPCNQEELGYVLLTFGYVFLRSMRRLGLQLSAADEEAYLHTWNVVGHMMGIDRALLMNNMDAASRLFSKMQARGRAEWHYKRHAEDPRPLLGHALVNSMQKAMSTHRLRGFPALMTYYLCGHETARDLGILKRTHAFWRFAFVCFVGMVKMIDWLLRRLRPGLSLARFGTRTLGYRFATALFADKKRPLNLPEHIRAAVNDTIAGWRHDPTAPDWVNVFGRRLTIPESNIAPPSESGINL